MLIIAGHNYKSHFYYLKDLSVGEIIRFIDVGGTIWTYNITSIEKLSFFEVEEMKDGDCDLTLFTCYYLNNSQRLTLR